jgi:8-oxo-dGTP diphosphatase
MTEASTLSRVEAEVSAAGGVVWRDGGGGVEVLAVHRPRYDDWSLPKGKLDRGESFEDAALREVEEETGIVARLGAELEPVRYRDDKGRGKLVRYWMMEVEEQGPFEPSDEVDEIRWLSPVAAADALTYPRDVELVRDAAARLS